MFKEIKKKKNEISKEKTLDLLTKCKRGVISFNGEDNYPYCIPINYFFDRDNNKIYFHGCKSGYKVDLIKKCNKICFTVIGNKKIIDETWAPYLSSAVVFGRCHLLENNDDNIKLLKKFALKYYPNEEMVDKEIKLLGKVVQLFEIEIEHISGKQIQEK